MSSAATNVETGASLLGTGTLIVVPTYNERENLPNLVAALRQIVPGADLLIVDDNSPDGTGQIADSLCAKDARVHVLHRTAKDGLGRAYVAGFGWGLARQKYARFVQMDADFSHDPNVVPKLIAASQTCDLVLGSRYVPGGGTENWNAGRRFLSRFGSLYARLILNLPQNDLTGGFKCWNRRVLESIHLESIASNGYSFQIEMTYRAALRGFTIGEVPIVFADRTVGASKMSKRIVFEAVGMVWKLKASAPTIRALPAPNTPPPTV